MNIHELQRLAENKPDVLLFNPLLKDFSVKFADFEEVILKANEITPVDGKIAERVKGKLATFIINERELDPMADKDNKISKEIEVNL